MEILLSEASLGKIEISVRNPHYKIGPGKALQISILAKQNNFPPITFWWIMKYSNQHVSKSTKYELNVICEQWGRLHSYPFQ